jgi:hypothetical protein
MLEMFWGTIFCAALLFFPSVFIYALVQDLRTWRVQLRLQCMDRSRGFPVIAADDSSTPPGNRINR